MKLISQFFLLYILFMMVFPPHAMDHCEHEETHTELNTHHHDTHEHPEGNCCPPFSLCKHCSLFAPLTIYPNWAIVSSTFTIENHPTIPSITLKERIHNFWHPPKFA